MAISSEKIKEIIDHVDIVDLVQSYGIKLEKSGRGYKALCPFHDDKNPSFQISVEKKIAKCMSCGEGGLPLTFVAKMDNCSIPQAAKKLADRYGVKLDVPIHNKVEDKNTKYYEIMNFALGFYQNFLKKSINKDQALEYLHNRRLSDETIDMFSIGLAPNKSNSLCLTMLDNGVSMSDLEFVGLAKQNEGRYYDVFRNRIIFPIMDEIGRVVGFSARRYRQEEADQPKYINSPETVLFKKGLLLYNLHRAKLSIKRQDRLVLFEGFLDVISSTTAGITEGVCSMGTALTKECVDIIKRHTKNVIICYDGDDAGVKATYKAADMLTSSGLNVKILPLPDKLDPDEYIVKYGADKYQQLFSNALVGILEYKYKQAKSLYDLSDFQMVEQFKREAFSIIKNNNSQAVNELFLRKMAVDLNVSSDALTSDYNSYFNMTPSPKNVENSKQKKEKIDAKLIGCQRAERILVKHMLDGFDMVQQIGDSIELRMIPFDELNWNLYSELRYGYYCKGHTIFDEIDFLDNLENEQLKQYYLQTIAPVLIANKPGIIQTEIDDSFNKIENYYLYKIKEEYNQKIAFAKTDEEKITLTLERDVYIKKLRK